MMTMLGHLLLLVMMLMAGLCGPVCGQNTEVSTKTCTYSFVVPQTDIVSTCRAYSSSLVASLNQKIVDLQNRVSQLQFSRGTGGSQVNTFLNSHFSCSCDNQTSFTFAYRDCQDVKVLTGGVSGAYQIEPVKSTGQILAVTNSSSISAKSHKYWVTETQGPFTVFCDLSSETVGWTLLMRRSKMDVSFDRTWNDYKNGFGSIKSGDFWLGLEKMHQITTQRYSSYIMWIIITQKSGVPHVFPYEKFVIGAESSGYRLTTGKFQGKLTNQLQSGVYFFTKDKTKHNTTTANYYSYRCLDLKTMQGGGWWLKVAGYRSSWYSSQCGSSNLNAKKPYWSGINDIKSVEMKIRPTDV